MNIVRLQMKNFLSIADAELVPGKVNQITGPNCAGKTTVLRAIETAMRGSTDGSLVKRGETQAEIILEFDDGTSVHRRLKADGSQDVRVTKDQMVAKAPQTFLSKLFGAGAFNPLELLEPKSRTEAILRAMPIRIDEDVVKKAAGEMPVGLPPFDYGDHGLKIAERVHDYFYRRRAEANADAKQKREVHRVKAADLVPVPEAGADAWSEAQLTAAINETKARIRDEEQKGEIYKERERELSEVRKRRANIETRDRELRKEIDELQRKVDAVKSRLEENAGVVDAVATQEKNAEERLEECKVDAHLLADEGKKISIWQEWLAWYARKREVEAKHREIAVYDKSAADAEAFAAKLDAVVGRLGRPFLDSLVSGARKPIDGLDYVNGVFTLDGTPLDHLSTSQAIRLGVAIARAGAGDLKVICVDGAEALDADSFEAFRRETEGDGFTYFVSVVGNGFDTTEIGDKAFFMEAGHVAGTKELP